MRYVKYFFWLLIVVVGVTFASLNPSSVTINYYWDHAVLPLPVLLVLFLVCGVFLGVVAMVPVWLNGRCGNRRLRQQMRALEEEIQNLRTMPLKDTR